MQNLKNTISALLLVALALPLLAHSQEEHLYENWGIAASEKKSSIRLQEALKGFVKKKDVVVAVIDTGVDYQHPFLAHNLWLPNEKITAQNFGRDFSKAREGLGSPTDKHGHGTHIAGIIKGIYKDVKILALKYYNPQASGEENLASTIQALKFAVDANVDIINYSGGGPEASAQELELLKIAEQKGILVVAASGNDHANIDLPTNAYYPASYGLSNIMTVTAHGRDLKVLDTSNFGEGHVDISAPGDRIKSSLPNGRSGFLTGTSQATAFVTGVAALMKARHPNLTAAQLKSAILGSAKKMKSIGATCSTQGVLDAGAAMKVARKLDVAPQRLLAQNPGKITYRRIKK